MINVGNYAGTILVDGGIGINADGNLRGTVETVAIGGDLVLTGDTAVTVNRSGGAPFARNKVLQKDNLTVPGNIMSVSNLSGYGLEFTGDVTMTGPSHFSVGVASSTVQNSGLIFSGTVTDGAQTYGLIKSGPGTLELLGVNDFGGASRTVEILGGVLAANSDAALGHPDNTVTLSADGLLNVGFRATETFSTARTFVLAQSNNAFEVALGKTLTLTTPFSRLAGNGVALGKSYGGVLELAADNTGWTGPITVTGGALRVSVDGAVGSGAITVSPNNWFGSALELAGGVTLANAVSLQGGNNVFYGGIDFGGQLSSVSGSNTVTGPVTLAFDAAIGVRTGSTLTLTGGVSNITTNRALALNTEGTLVVSGASGFSFGSGATSFYSIRQFGGGTLNVKNDNFAVRVTSGQWTHLKGGTMLLDEAGTWGAPIYVDKGSSLILDDRSINVSGAGHTTANGRLATSSANDYDVGFRGGELLIRSSQFVNDSMVENIAKPTFARGSTVISLENNAPGGTGFGKVTLMFWTIPDDVMTRSQRIGGNNGASVLFRGDNFGISLDPGATNVIFAGGNRFAGVLTNLAGNPPTNNAGTTGSNNKAILPWALVSTTLTGLGDSFATSDNFGGGGSATSGDRIIRPLGNAEYLTNPASVTPGTGVTNADNRNLRLNGTASQRGMGLSVRPLSLTLGDGAGIAMADGAQLSLHSGGLLVLNGSNSVISGGVINQIRDLPNLNVWTVGTSTLTLSTSLAGGNWVNRGEISFVKAGAGTLIFDPPTAAVTGLSGYSTNSLSGQFALNEGTVVLGAGMKNTIQANNYASLTGGTLDLNGGSQFFYGVFADQDYDAGNTVVTSSSGAAHFIVNNDNNGRNWAGSIQGQVSFTRSGANSLSLWSAHTYTGGTVINGGNVILYDNARLSGTSSIDISYAGLYLDNNQQKLLVDRIADAAPITLRGGVLELRGRQQAATRETVGLVTLAASNSTISTTGSGVAGSSAVLTLSGLNRSVFGGTVSFNGNQQGLGVNGTSTRIVIQSLNGADMTVPSAIGTGLTNGILGGWAVVNASEWASHIPGLGIGALGADGFPTYSNLTSAANTVALAAVTDNVNINAAVTGAVSVGADTTLNSLRFGDANNTLDIGAGRTLTLTSGGLLLYLNTDNRTQTIGSASSQGSLTSGGSELFIYNRHSGGTNRVQRINASIVDNGSPVALIKSGNGLLRLAGVNAHTGGTFVNEGTLSLEAGSNIPAAADPLRGLVIAGANVVTAGPGQVASSNYVTIGGSGSINYWGDNVQYGLVLDNVGSSGNPTVRTYSTLTNNGAGSRGVLTVGAGGIVATSANVGTISLIEGRLSFGAAGGTVDVSAIDVNGYADVDPLRAGLQIQGLVDTSGTVTKTGDGVLQLNAQGHFTGDFVVAEGGLRAAVGNAGSRFSDLTVAAGARYDVAGQTTAWGSLSGGGDIFSSNGVPDLYVGYNGSDSAFSGRFVGFNDASYLGLLRKVGSGVMTMTSAQDAAGSWTGIYVEGGRVVYAGAGRAFQATTTVGSAFMRVDDGAVLELSNAAQAVNNRLGLATAGTFENRGGRLIIGGSATAPVSERFTTLTFRYGGGRIELAPVAGQSLLLDVGNVISGQSDGSLVIAGITGNAAGAGVANLKIGTVNFYHNAQQGGGYNGTTNMSVRGDILADAATNGRGTGFLVRDGFLLNGIATLNNDPVVAVPDVTGIVVGASVTGSGFAGNWTVSSVDGANSTVTLTGGTTIAGGLTSAVISNFWRPLAESELNLTPRGPLEDNLGGWAQGQNAGVLGTSQTLLADTVANTLTFTGAASLTSGLGAAFGSYGPGGRLLTQQLYGANGILVKSGTADIGVGSLTSGDNTIIWAHVLLGATLNLSQDTTLGISQTGLVKAGDGVMNIRGLTNLNNSVLTVNGGRLNLDSGRPDTIAVLARSGGALASSLRVEGVNAVVDLSNQPQTFNEIRSSTERGSAGVITNSGASFVNLTTIGNSAFVGDVSGKINLVRAGNTTTLLTGANSYTGQTVIRGGTLQLRDAGALTGTSGVTVNNGLFLLDNFGLNPVENFQRIGSTTPFTLRGGEIRVDGAGSSDIAVTLGAITAAEGHNSVTSRPAVNMANTNVINVSDVLLTAGGRQTVSFSAYSNLNSSGYGTLANQSLIGSSYIYVNKVNGAVGPANFNFTGVSTTNGNRFVTVASTAGMSVGLRVTGTNMPANATITAITSPTQIQISANATGTTTSGSLRATNLTNDLIGGWAIADGTSFASYDSRFGVIPLGFTNGGFAGPAYAGIDVSAATVATGNYSDGGTNRTLSGSKAAYSWRLGGSANYTLTLGASANLTLGLGIVTNANVAATVAATDATNTITTAGGDLYVFTNQNTLTLQPRLTGAMGLIKSGGAALTLAPQKGNNDYTGGTYLNQGTLNLSADSGRVSVPAGGLYLGGNATLNVGTALQQIDPSTDVVFRNRARMLYGNRTLVAGTDIVERLNSVTFNSEGGNGNPDFYLGDPNDVAAFFRVVLGGATPVTSTNNDSASVPVIYTGDAARTRLEFSDANPQIRVNAGLAPVGLMISAPIGQNVTMTSLSKVGAGTLGLNSVDSEFTTGFQLLEGALMIGNNSTSDGSGGVTKGPVGTGTLTVSGGTAIFSDNTARTIHNAVDVLGDFTFGGRNAGASLTLAGNVSLGAATRTITVESPAVTATLAGVVSSSAAPGTPAFVKAGAGTLVIGGTGSLALSGAGVSVTGGVLRQASANAVASGSPLTVGAGSGFDLAGFALTLDEIAGSGFITNSGNTPVDFTVGSAVDSDFSGVIADNAGNVLTAASRLSLVKLGAGILTLRSTQLYAGTTTINEGDLLLASSGLLGPGVVTVALSANLRLGRTDTFTFANVIEGAGALRKQEAGTAVITGDTGGAFSGEVHVEAGTLQLGAGGADAATGSFGSALSIDVAPGATLRLARSDSYDLSNPLSGLDITSPISGDGTIEQAGLGSSTLSATNPFTGDVNVISGVLRLATSGALEQAGLITVASGGRIDFVGDGALGDGSSYPFVPVTVNGGRLHAEEFVSAQFGALTLNGGLLSGDGNVSGSFGFSGVVSVTDDAVISAPNVFVGSDGMAPLGSFDVAAGKTLTVSGGFIDSFFGATEIIKDGAGTMILAADNAHTGAVTINAGTLQVGTGAATGTLGDVLSPAALSLGAGATLLIDRSGSFELGHHLGGSGTVIQAGPGVTSVTGTNDGSDVPSQPSPFTGRFVLQGGVLSVADAGKFGTSDDTDPTRLVLAGGSLAYLDDTASLLRAFTVENGGAGFVADGNMPILIGDGSTAQLDFDNAAASNRVLTLSGLGTADHTFAPALAESEAAGLAFSSIVKEGVGKWIIGSSGDALNTDADVTVNAGILGFTAGALGGVSHVGNVTLADQTTLRWESGNTDDVSARLRAAAGATAVALDFAGGSTAFASGVNLGSTELIKQGAGALTLSAANTMGAFTQQGGTVIVTHASALGSGQVTVDGGTLRVNAAISNEIDVNAGGTLGGTGSLNLGSVSVATGGTFSPGNSPDTFYGVSMGLGGGSTYRWEVQNADLAAGTGYDFLSLTGALDLSGASSANRITLKLVSLNAAGEVGLAQNFTNNVMADVVRTFNFASVGSLNLGANTNINDLFTVDISEFTYTDGTATDWSVWSLSYDGSGSITLTAVPEPSTYGFGLGALALAAAAVRRRRKQAPTKG